VKPRITISLTADRTLEIWLNAAGRDVLVAELRALDERHEHFHLAPKDQGEVKVSTRPYHPTDDVIDYAEVLFRTDSWDERYFPHVMRTN